MRLLLATALGTALAASAHGAVSAKRLPLEERVIRTGDFTGFTAPARPQLFDTAAAWSTGFPHPAAEMKRLQKLGFVGAAFEHLTPKLAQRDAVSVVIQFRTSAAARTNMTYSIATDATGGTKVTRFAVRGIPGASGLYAHRSDGAGYDVVFVDGPFFYDVGGYTPDPRQPPTAAQVAAAATKLYRRVHGHPAG